MNSDVLDDPSILHQIYMGEVWAEIWKHQNEKSQRLTVTIIRRYEENGRLMESSDLNTWDLPVAQRLLKACLEWIRVYQATDLQRILERNNL